MTFYLYWYFFCIFVYKIINLNLIVMSSKIRQTDYFDWVIDSLFDGFEIKYGKYGFESNENEYLVKIPLAGVPKENILVKVEQNYLIVSVIGSSFKRKILLPYDVDIDNISGESKDGMLTITLPKGSKDKNTIKIK